MEIWEERADESDLEEVISFINNSDGLSQVEKEVSVIAYRRHDLSVEQATAFAILHEREGMSGEDALLEVNDI